MTMPLDLRASGGFSYAVATPSQVRNLRDSVSDPYASRH